MEDVPIVKEVDVKVKDVEKKRKTATSDLSYFRRIPDRLSGEELLDHQIGFRMRQYAKKPNGHKISSHLMVSPRNEAQREMMEVDYSSRAMGNVMEIVGDGVSLKMAAQSQLNNIRAIRSHLAILNTTKALERQEDCLTLAKSVGDIAEVNEAEEKKKITSEKGYYATIYKQAVLLLRAGDTKKRTFTKDHARAILMLAYALTQSLPKTTGGLMRH